MPRYTEEQRRELEETIISAAADLVISHGWKACTTRQVGEVLNLSQGPVHDCFKGSELKKAVITLAYANLAHSVIKCLPSCSRLDDVLPGVAAMIVSDADISALAVQVTSLFAAPSAEFGTELRATVREKRTLAAQIIAADLEAHGLYRRRDELPAWTGGLVTWFEASCALFVMNPGLSALALRKFAYGVENL